jgi:hypothetical protein
VKVSACLGNWAISQALFILLIAQGITAAANGVNFLLKAGSATLLQFFLLLAVETGIALYCGQCCGCRQQVNRFAGMHVVVPCKTAAQLQLWHSLELN